MPVVGALVLGKARIPLDAELRFLAVTLERQSGLFKPGDQIIDKVAQRLVQVGFEQILVLNEPLPVLVKIQRLEEGQRLVAKAFENRLAHAPTRVNQASSSMTSMPRDCACVSLEPAPGPATTRSVFFETDPAVLAP